MKPFPYAFWLMPCEEQRGMLQESIDSLAARFNTPAFVPHVTLCSGTWEQGESVLIKAVDQLAPESEVEMDAVKLDWTEQWSTFFFLRLQCGSDLSERVVEHLSGSHAPAVGLHLSLLYCFGGDPLDREALRNELADMLPEVIRFDSTAVAIPSTGSWSDVDEWKIVRRRP